MPFLAVRNACASGARLRPCSSSRITADTSAAAL